MRQIARLSLRDLLYVLCRDRWKIAATMLAALAVAGAWLVFLADTIYVAESRVLVRMGREKLTGIETLNRDNANFLFQERGQDINNTIELLRDPQFIYPVLDKLVAEIGPPPPPPTGGFARLKHEAKVVMAQVMEWATAPLYWVGLRTRMTQEESVAQAMRGAMRVEGLEDTDVIRVTFGWTDPVFAARAANTVVDSLLARQVQVYGSDAPGRFYVDQLVEHGERVKTAETALETFRARHQITNLPLQKELLLREVTEAEARRNEVGLRLAEHRALRGWLGTERSLAESAPDGGGWPTTPEVRGRQVVDLSALDRQYFELVARRAQLAATHLAQSPEMQQIAQRMAGLRRQKLDTLGGHIRTALDIDSREQAALDALLDEKRRRLQLLNAASVEHGELDRQRQTAEQTLLAVNRKTEELRVVDLLNERQISGLRVMSEARPPARPAAPRRGLVLGLALAIGLLLGLAYSALVEYFDHTFRGKDDVKSTLGVPLLMTVPRVRAGSVG